MLSLSLKSYIHDQMWLVACLAISDMFTEKPCTSMVNKAPNILMMTMMKRTFNNTDV